MPGISPGRLRLWLERDRRGAGYHLRDAATGERVAWEDERIRVVPVAGVSFRGDAVADASFDPGARLALVPEPENEHDPNAIAVWNEARSLQAGYVPRDVAAQLRGDEQAVSLWRAGEGLRVLIVDAEAWVARPRRRSRDPGVERPAHQVDPEVQREDRGDRDVD